MILKCFKSTCFVVVITLLACGNSQTQTLTNANTEKTTVSQSVNTKTTTHNTISKTTTANARPLAIIVGANRMEDYLPKLKNKRVAIVGNQTSIVFKDLGYVHLVDALLSRQVLIKKVFAPEHGFRGTADAGEKIKDSKDVKTGLPIISLYGDNKKPTKAQLADIDIVVFDIQDVGARFYTYISTLHYVMEACAETGIELLILDRPNPNGNYIDGPILEKEHSSFVGMHPVPVVHGMTIGEYAIMINGEGWLKSAVKADLSVIPVKNYNKSLAYGLPVNPSPNLPNALAISLYPSLCFFEGTNVNAGRGTDKQFQVFGSPFLNSKIYNYSYTPQPNEGSKYPKHQGQRCYGMDLSQNIDNSTRVEQINLTFLIDAYHHTQKKEDFFNDFFTKLAGTNKLKKQIEKGMTAVEISKTWQTGLKAYDQMRKPYEIYKRK